MVSVNIPKPDLVSVRASITGIAPGLLLNPFGQKAEAQLLASMQKKVAKNARGDKDPAAEYRSRLEEVTVSDGVYWTNILSFKAAMLRGSMSIDKLKMTTVRAGLFVIPDDVEGGFPRAHLHGVAEPFSTHVKNQGGAPDYRTRVLLSSWKYQLDMQVNLTLLSIDQVAAMLVNAGAGVGIGDWRPEKNGVHGRWIVEAFDVL